MSQLDAVVALGIVPVVSVTGLREAEMLAGALVEGGLPIVEVVQRGRGALEAVARMAEEPRLTVGAGTIKTEAQLEGAVEAGARFLVSPGTSETLLRRAAEADVPLVPGAVTATEILRALDLGVTTAKFFPAATSGGPDALRALAGPFGEVGFIPTGGITAATVGDYLSVPSVRAVGGSWMVPQKSVAEGDHLALVGLVRAAVADAEAHGRISA